MAELARIMVRRTTTFGVAAFAAAALMGLGAGSAAADNFGPSCEAPQGPMVDGERYPAVQGELRAARNGEVLAQGSPNGNGSANLGRAVPNSAPAYAFGGAIGDMTRTSALPGTAGWLREMPNACR